MKIKYYNFLFTISLLLFYSNAVLAQTILYSEDFSDASLDDKGHENGVTDMAGVTNWTIDPSGGSFASGDYMKQSNGEFQVVDPDGTAFWGSLVIDISCYTNVTLSVETIDAGNNDVEALYRLNGGPLVSMGAPGSAIRTVNGLTGSTIQIIVRYTGTSSTGYQAHDDVLITGEYSTTLCPIPAGSPSCGGFHTDSDAGTAAGTYGNNLNYTSTVCPSTPGELTTVTFEDLDIGAGDILNIYEGDDITGPLLGTVTSATALGFSISSYDCITFNWITDGNDTNNEGYWASILCEIPSSNPQAADDFANAPLICDLSTYSGSTSGNTADNPFNMTGGGNCPTLFGGTIENNSWFSFIATSTSIDILVTPTSCNTGGGIQAAILAFDGSNFTRISECVFSDGTQSTPFNLTAFEAPLVVGDTYYVMVDGNAGSTCTYDMEMQSGFTPMTIDASPAAVCSGDPSTLTVSNATTTDLVWFADDPSFGSDYGSPLIVNPTTTTTYTVLARGACAGTTADVSVTVNACASCSLDGITAGAQTACDPATNTYTQDVTINYTNPPASGTLDVNGQSFPILASPQTVTLTGLAADANAVDVLANFSANASCTLTEVALFTAPASCSASPCTPDNGTWD